MTTRRLFFWILVCLALAGIIAAVSFSRRPVVIHARIAEDGGFTPSSIKARAGEPLRLRLIADDVTHTFALGQNPMEPVTLIRRAGSPFLA
jgi:hypothetical protein